MPAEVNGIALDFTVDSGAATVMVPAEGLDRMRRERAVTEADILGPQRTVLADGALRTFTGTHSSAPCRAGDEGRQG